MRRVLIALACALALSGCARFNAAYSGLTSATITANQVQALELAFIATEKTATQYVLLPSCTPPDHPVICSKDEAISPLAKAVTAARVAVDNVVQLQEDHPEQLGATGLYDAAKVSYDTLLAIMTKYGVGETVK